MNSQALDNSLTFPVDKEHGGIRLVIILSFIGVWIVSFMVFNLLVSNSGVNLLAVILSFALAYGATAALEMVLKRRWPSGRVVQISADGARLLKKGNLQAEIMSEDPASTLLWSFQISKRARVPKGWSMLACALEYENQYLTVYTFMSPAQVASYELAGQFTKLTAKRKKDQPDVRDDLRLAGEQRRLRDAENYRWLAGAEMVPADFITYISQIRAQFPEWQL